MVLKLGLLTVFVVLGRSVGWWVGGWCGGCAEVENVSDAES